MRERKNGRINLNEIQKEKNASTEHHIYINVYIRIFGKKILNQ